MALRARGHACPVVSVGSTPTATFAESFDGVTEVRTGVYMFQDLVMAGLGVCAIDDIAISVLASVIGHQRDKNWIITDAGWMAMSRDRGTQKQKIDQGYGVVCDAAGMPIDDLIVVDANQEHGIVARRDGGAIDFALSHRIAASRAAQSRLRHRGAALRSTASSGAESPSRRGSASAAGDSGTLGI